VIDNPESTWTDQRNKLDQMHTLEMKFFERSIEFFFNSQFGCYVLDDELLASKAADVEYKQLSDRKAGGKGLSVMLFVMHFSSFIWGYGFEYFDKSVAILLTTTLSNSKKSGGGWI
jgi:hypothetical protein